MEEKISDRIKESYGQAQILVIDDSIFSRTLITRELINIGFNEDQVQQAGSGRVVKLHKIVYFFSMDILYNFSHLRDEEIKTCVRMLQMKFND